MPQRSAHSPASSRLTSLGTGSASYRPRSVRSRSFESCWSTGVYHLTFSHYTVAHFHTGHLHTCTCTLARSHTRTFARLHTCTRLCTCNLAHLFTFPCTCTCIHFEPRLGVRSLNTECCFLALYTRDMHHARTTYPHMLMRWLRLW
jgi:hypothetical protein